MKKSVFDFDDYKIYILNRISEMPSKGRGVRLKLSEHLSCQTAYISQVLNQYTHFSLEQSVKINNFFSHNKEESRFFLLLVQFARAGSKELEQFIQSEINEILIKRSELQNRLYIKDRLDETNQHIYYSVWYYAAIHILLSIPEFQTPKSIAKYLSLPIEIVHEVIEFLCETGLAISKSGKFEIGKTSIHLDKNSVHIRRHHTNWRNQAINSIDKNKKNDLHYSNVISISHKDKEKVKEILFRAVEECREIIRDSPEEDLQVLSIDFFGY